MGTHDFAALLITNSDFLKPFAITLTRDTESAQDLLQDTMFRALSNREKYNVGTNIKAWLYTIMRNIFINNYRKKAKQQVVFDTTPHEVLINQKQVIGGNVAESNMALKELWSSVHSLPGLFRKPFLLYFEGYKYHEIAQALNEPLGTIKSRIHFARKLLKEQITRY